MILILQIAIGIWLGGLFLLGTISAYFALSEKIERNKRQRNSWHTA